MSDKNTINCREGCGACCIAASISSAIPGMPNGKKAGEPCIHLDDQMRCRIFRSPDRPNVCTSLKPNREMCGSSREEALAYLEQLEEVTRPDPFGSDGSPAIGGGKQAKHS